MIAKLADELRRRQCAVQAATWTLLLNERCSDLVLLAKDCFACV